MNRSFVFTYLRQHKHNDSRFDQEMNRWTTPYTLDLALESRRRSAHVSRCCKYVYEGQAASGTPPRPSPRHSTVMAKAHSSTRTVFPTHAASSSGTSSHSVYLEVPPPMTRYFHIDRRCSSKFATRTYPLHVLEHKGKF
jgi:hypothetical protein